MGSYLGHDIETDDAGEIQLENGDLKLASSKRSFLQCLNWIVMTNRSESYTPDAMANLGSYLGSLNIPTTHRGIEAHVRQAVTFQGLFDPNDLFVKVIPVTIDSVSLTVRMAGEYTEDREEDTGDPTVGYQTLGYVFPFDNATPVRVT
jgi:hypothetical protein